MNDKERDRCSDGAGPAAPDDGGPHRRQSLLAIYIFLLLSIALTGKIVAQEGSGLSLTIDAGMLRANDVHANFYNGSEDNTNTIYRVIHSQAYGEEIWRNLKNPELTPNTITDAVANYNQLTVVEYGNMHYKLAFNLDIGIRYEYNGGWAWLLRVDYSKLNAVGAFNISRDNSTGIVSGTRYVTCDIAGQESRIARDLGLSKRFYLHNRSYISIESGGRFNNTKVLSNDIRIAGNTYSILDVWGGENPSAYTVPYEYINQGGLGYGAFATLSYGIAIPGTASVAVAYTLSCEKINLQGYTSFALQHLFGLRFDLTGMVFFND